MGRFAIRTVRTARSSRQERKSGLGEMAIRQNLNLPRAIFRMQVELVPVSKKNNRTTASTTAQLPGPTLLDFQ